MAKRELPDLHFDGFPSLPRKSKRTGVRVRTGWSLTCLFGWGNRTVVY